MDEAHKKFDKMKEVMRTCPVLAFPDFTQPFVLECDASGEGIGEFLMHHMHLIEYESINITKLERIYSIYDKEILSIIHALVNFRQYFVGGKFLVKTYHNSLRHFLG
jgi:hypothetical protein